MLLIKAIVRPEKSDDIIQELSSAGFYAVTKLHVSGRGAETISSAADEIPMVALYIVCSDENKDSIVDIIIKTGRTGEHGDGRIVVSEIEEAYTISTGERGL